MAKRIGVGLVGAGKVGALHAAALSRAPGAELMAVCDQDEERAKALAEAHGTAVDSFSRLLADHSIEAIVLATPTEDHLAHARRAVAAGKHVLCEFPLFGGAAALAGLFDRARRQATVLRAAHTTHYLPPYAAARRMITRGSLGQVRSVLYRRRLFRPGGIAADRAWRDNALTHLGGHALDLVTWLVDRPPEAMRSAAVPSAQAASTTGLLARLEGGCIACISIDFESRPNAILLEVAGSGGTLAATGFSKVEVDGQVVWDTASDDAAYRAAIDAQDSDFIRAIRHPGDDTAGAVTRQLNDWMARALKSQV